MENIVHITYKCLLNRDRKISKKELEEIIDRTSLCLHNDHGGDIINQSVVHINTSPGKCKYCTHWADYFNSSDALKFCPDCGEIVHNPRNKQTEAGKMSGLKMTSGLCDSIEVFLNPQNHPVSYQRRKKDLIENLGFSEKEAEYGISNTSFILEVFYDPNNGMFAVEAENLDCKKTYNPFTGTILPYID